MKIVADENIPFAREFFSSLGNAVLMPGRKISPPHVADADILLVRSVTRVDEPLLSGSSVNFVGTATAGQDHIDLHYLRKNAIAYVSAAGANAESVAEYVVAALLEIAGMRRMHLGGLKAGIVGCGNVGGRVMKKLSGLGLRCRANDPPLEDAGVQDLVSFAQAADSDIISFHTPLTLSGAYPTFHLADYDFFMNLPTGAAIINTSRGPVFDNDGLLKALQARDDLNAVLDVWEGEPEVCEALVEKAAIATPHIAGYSLEGKAAGTEMLYRAACAHLGIPEHLSLQSIMPSVSDPVVSPEKSLCGDDLLRKARRHCYDIQNDDRQLRAALAATGAGARGDAFDRLRRDYPVRREFHCYTVRISRGREQEAEGLRALGFHTRMH